MSNFDLHDSKPETQTQMTPINGGPFLQQPCLPFFRGMVICRLWYEFSRRKVFWNLVCGERPNLHNVHKYFYRIHTHRSFGAYFQNPTSAREE
jgi:hypothetical protein